MVWAKHDFNRATMPRMLGVCFMALLNSCAQMDIQTDFDPSSNFTDYKTFTWLSDSQKNTGDRRIDDPLLDSQVRTAVEQRLSTQGFQKQSSGQPDFFIAYRAVLKDKWNPPGLNPYTAPLSVKSSSSWDVGTLRVGQYADGTLLLYIFDGTTNDLIWKGSAQAEVELTSDPRDTEKIEEAVRRILEKFPPK